MIVLLIVIMFLVSLSVGYLFMSITASSDLKLKELALFIKIGMLNLILLSVPFNVWLDAVNQFQFGRSIVAVVVVIGLGLGIVCRYKKLV